MSSKESLLGVRGRWEISSSFSFKIKTLLMLVCSTVFLFILLFSFSAGYTQAVGDTTGEFTENSEISILSNHDDMDRDGIDDATELSIGTEPNNYYGDRDKDGLYDFEEYLDIYGTPNITTDEPRYDYDDNTTHNGTGDVPILDIYHYFNLDTNKDGFVRDDNNYTLSSSALTDQLLWNVTFREDYAGGSQSNTVSYVNNILNDVVFSGTGAGGTFFGAVSYVRNTFDNVNFSGAAAGGSQLGIVSYVNNTLNDVAFSGNGAGGSQSNTVSYANNTLNDVAFSGTGAGGSRFGAVSYTGNAFDNVTFGGNRASGGVTVSYVDNAFDNVTFSGDRASGGLTVSYVDNDFDNVTFSGNTAGGGTSVSYIGNAFDNVIFSGDTAGGGYGRAEYINNTFETVTFSGDTAGGGTSVSYVGNTFETITFDGWYAGGSRAGTVVYESNSFTNVRYNKSTTSEDVYGNSGLSGSGLTNYTNNIFDQVQYVQLDKGIAEFNVTSIGNTIMTDSYDSDGDGLGDIFEFFTSKTNPEQSDTDADGLNDSYEVDIGLDAGSSDTDADGLNDAWELLYNGSSGVNPLVAATEAELGSDVDMDGFNLSGEAARGTNPENVISVATPRETTSAAATSSIERQGSLSSPLMPLVMLMVALSTGILISGWVRRRSKHRGNEYT